MEIQTPQSQIKLKGKHIYVLVFLLTFLNFYQLAINIQKKKANENLIKEVKILNHNLLDQEIADKNKSTRFVNYFSSNEYILDQNFNKFNFGILSIIPLQTCYACVDYDAKVLKKFKMAFPNHSKLIFITRGDSLIKKPYYNTFRGMKHTKFESFAHLFGDEFNQFEPPKFPIHLAVFNGHVIGVHETSFYDPELTEKFFDKFRILFE